MPPLSRKKQPFVFIIIDGWGVAEPSAGNAIYLAKTPVFNQLMEKYPYTLLEASGKFVGLPKGQAGNSEAGHMNIGAGRTVLQDVERINRVIDNRLFFKNAAFLQAIEHVRVHKSRLHLLGMLSDGQSGHAYPRHLYSLLQLLGQHDLQHIYLHLFTDGRDAPPYSAIKLYDHLKRHFADGEMTATVMGRFYGMERNKRWEITKRAYEALVLGRGLQAKNTHEAIVEAYNRGESDEFIQPTVIGDRERVRATRIQDNDAVIFFNLRSDRARQLTKVFVQSNFSKKNIGSFRRVRHPKNLLFVAMTDFGPDLGPIVTAFPAEDLKGTLPMAMRSRKQLYVAESEKYAHITYFFNGGYADPVAGEDRVMIPSPTIPTYADMPEMSTFLITQLIKQNIRHHLYDVYVANFANVDMVGHTGNLRASIKAVQAVDKALGILYKEVVSHKGILVVTADHGNTEEMVKTPGGIDTGHSTHPVPFLAAGQHHPLLSRRRHISRAGALAHVAPTVLRLLDLPQPAEMTATSLL